MRVMGRKQQAETGLGSSRLTRFAWLLLPLAIGALGALPTGGSGSDPIALAGWLALIAPSLGACAGARGARDRLAALLLFGTWLLLLIAVDASSKRDLPEMHWAACALAGLFLGGYGLGSLAKRSPGWVAAALFLAMITLTALPAVGGLAPAPWPPALAARLLDISPVALILECGGVDWMRHPGVYAPVGTDAIGPDLRLAHRGFLAGPLTLLVGWSLASACQFLARRLHPASEDPRPCASSSAPSPRT